MKEKLKKHFWLIALWSIIAVSVVRIYFTATDDFRIGNMIFDMPHHPEWEIATTPKQQALINKILQKRFSYLSKGAQSYVFESDDHKYVLKFFKFKHLKPSPLVNYLPPISPFAYFQQKEIDRKQRKLYEVFSGHKLAYDFLRKESGLIYIQLNPTHLHRPITVIDKLGFEREVDLGKVVFVIQEKGDTLRAVLSNLLAQGNSAGAKMRIRQVLNLYLSEYRKGLYDHDHGVMRNIGFVANEPIHLDIGKVMADERMKKPEYFRNDLLKVIASIDHWLLGTHPNYHDELSEDIQLRLKEIFPK